MDSSTEQVRLYFKMVILTMDNFLMENLTEKESSSHRITSIKVVLSKVSIMDSENTFGNQEVIMKAIT